MAGRPTDPTRQRARTTPPRKWRTVFLRELAVDGNRRRAAEVAQVDHSTVYEHRHRDSEFRTAWDAAIDQAAEYLEAEAWRRATEGVEEPLTSAKGLIYGEDGAPVTVRRYSDHLMGLLLKAARPSKYRDNVHVTAQQQQLGITVVLESMRDDSRLADAAADFVALIESAGPPEGEPSGAGADRRR